MTLDRPDIIDAALKVTKGFAPPDGDLPSRDVVEAAVASFVSIVAYIQHLEATLDVVQDVFAVPAWQMFSEKAGLTHPAT